MKNFSTFILESKIFNNFTELVSWSKDFAKDNKTKTEYKHNIFGGNIMFIDDNECCYIQIKYENKKLIADTFISNKEIKNLNELKKIILDQKKKIESGKSSFPKYYDLKD